MLSLKSKLTSENPSFTKNGVSGRRALGDITNSVVDEPKEIVTKKSFVSTNPPLPAQNVRNVMEPERAYMLRSCDDIDERDSDNPLLVTDYVNKMYEHFNNTENEFMVSYSYMARQEFVNERMRAILVDWLVSLF